MSQIDDAFLEAERLLRKYGFITQAEEVRKGLEAVQTQGAAGYRQLATVSWWGPSDSIADTYLYKEGESLTMRQELDNRALRAALTTISDAMKAAGIEPPERT